MSSSFTLIEDFLKFYLVFYMFHFIINANWYDLIIRISKSTFNQGNNINNNNNNKKKQDRQTKKKEEKEEEEEQEREGTKK